jgi:hypothetical protein
MKTTLTPTTIDTLVDLVFSMHYNFALSHDPDHDIIDPCTWQEIADNLENPVALPIGTTPDGLPVHEIKLEQHQTRDGCERSIQYSLIKTDNQPIQFFI